MARWRVLATLVLVATAGCSGLAGQSGPDAPTVTPAEVPRHDSPPGVSVDPAAVDPDTLVEAHTSVLANRSVTLRKSTVRRAADGRRLGSRNWTVQYAPDRRFFADMTAEGDLSTYPWGKRSAYWANDTRAAVLRSVYGTLEVRGGRPANVIPPFERTLAGRLEVLFSEVSLDRVVRIDGSDPAVYRLVGTASGEVAGSALRSGARIRNVTLSARVDERGFVRRYTLAYTDHRDSGRATVQVRVRFTDVGTTTVQRPPWVDQGLGATAWTDADPRCTNVHSPHPPSC
jgi:hypothetical protein